MGNASSSVHMQRERHKSTDLSTPSSPAHFRDSIGGGGGGGGQAFSFDKKHTAVLNEGSSQEDDDPYYTGTGTGSTRRGTAHDDATSAVTRDHSSMDNNEEEEEAAAGAEPATGSQLTGDEDDIRKTALPTVLRWDGGGKNVTISGTFSDWKPMAMVRSHQNFVTIIDLPEGDHQYKFCVDGEWKHDPKLVSWAENQYMQQAIRFQCF